MSCISGRTLFSFQEQRPVNSQAQKISMLSPILTDIPPLINLKPPDFWAHIFWGSYSWFPTLFLWSTLLASFMNWSQFHHMPCCTQYTDTFTKIINMTFHFWKRGPKIQVKSTPVHHGKSTPVQHGTMVKSLQRHCVY